MPSCDVLLLTTPSSEPSCVFYLLSESRRNFQPCCFPILKTQLPKFTSLRVKASSSSSSATTEERFISMEETEKQSFYELLGISREVSLVEIKQAYREMARKYHPDVSPQDRVEEYTQRFIRVQEAYETLSDPNRRALYDSHMAKGLHLAFSARRKWQSNEGPGGRSEWKNRWQSQVSELKSRSMNRDARGNMSWGARMRRQRDGSHN